MMHEFLNSVVVIDTETTAADPQQAEIVELATALHGAQGWQVQSSLFGSEQPMPPAASEVTGIHATMLHDLPVIQTEIHTVVHMLGDHAQYFVAHNAAYDRTVLTQAFAASSVPEMAELFSDAQRWICTLRLSRHVYGNSVASHRQNYLRYALDLPVPHHVGVHRAGADVQVCAALLETLVAELIATGRVDANSHIADQLVTLCAQPILVTVWPMGKHRGTLLTDLETDYLLWAVDNITSLQPHCAEYDADLMFSVTHALASRLE